MPHLTAVNQQPSIYPYMGDNCIRNLFVVCCHTLEMDAIISYNWFGTPDPQSINKTINGKSAKNKNGNEGDNAGIGG